MFPNRLRTEHSDGAMSMRRRPLFTRQSQQANKVPHRHAAPSAPWPWINIHDGVNQAQLATKLPPIPPPCDHKSCDGCWKYYPKSRFPNWTKNQVSRSRINDAITKYNKDPCFIFRADVLGDGIFEDVEPVKATEDNKDDTWNTMINTKRPPGIRVRALFIQNLSGPVLQMLGARYNIEPFYFSSSLNWIPSRYQEEIQDNEGDHITVTLTFLKSMPSKQISNRGREFQPSESSSSVPGVPFHGEQITNLRAPLLLGFDNRQLALDLLSVHLIRHVNGSTAISFHPETEDWMTTAKYLHERIRFAGQSVYWQKIFRESPDPTFVLLTFVWHAMYAWDEALEDLHAHIGQLETTAISSSDMALTEELHDIRAHQLFYSSLLADFHKTIEFIRVTKNPAMDSFPEATRLRSEDLMRRECKNLTDEVDRLDMSRRMLDKQLKNVMGLVFSSVQIKMTEATVKDSAGLYAHMKQVAFLTMFYLPASFIAAVFGMNVQEIAGGTTRGTLGHYAAVAVSFTVATIWTIIAFQSKHIFGEDISFWGGIVWPYMVFKKFYCNKTKEQNLGNNEA